MILIASQVEEFLDKIGEEVTTSIEKSYGENGDFTAVWNSTMKEVRHQPSCV